MDQMPKRVKRALRELAAKAHQEELRCALMPLSGAFQRWERGELPSGELTDLIHEFHQGPSRDLWGRYNSGMLEVVVAHAIVTGVLDRTKFPPEVLESLAPAIQFYEQQDRPHAGGIEETV
jgi:hypothetical protein